MINAEEIKKLTKEKQDIIIDDFIFMLETMILNSTFTLLGITVSLKSFQFPEYLIPCLESKLIDSGYKTKIIYDDILSVSRK